MTRRASSLSVRVCLAALALLAGVRAASAQTTALFFDSQPGDYIGQGQQHAYTPADGTFQISRYGSGLIVNVQGPSFSFWWSLRFSGVNDAPLTVGTYESARRFSTAANPAIDVSGSGRGCNQQTGRFVVREITYGPNDAILTFAADFEQHCEDAGPGLFGAIRYNSTISDLVPFGGDYPLYQMTITPDAHGRVTAAGLDCGGAATTCVASQSQPDYLRLTAVPNAGYAFAGWSGDCSGNVTIWVMLNQPKRCLARFEPGVQGITALFLDPQPGESIFGAPQRTFTDLDAVFAVSRNYKNGVSVSLVPPPGSAPGSWWWNMNFAATGPLAVGTYEAARRYASAPFNGFEFYGSGRGCDSAGRFVVREAVYATDGSVLRFAADFEHHCGNAVPALFSAIRFNSTITDLTPFGGQYPLYRLTIPTAAHGRVTGGGLDCGSGGSVCQVTLAGAAQLSITATPDSGYIFAGWTDDCLGPSTTSVHVNGPRVCSAIFEPLITSSPRTLLTWTSQPGDSIGRGTDGVYSALNSVWTGYASSDGNSVSLQIRTVSDYWSLDFSAPDGTALTPGYYPAARRSSPFNSLSISASGTTCSTVSGRFSILEVVLGSNGTVERFAADFEQHCNDAVPGLFGSIRYNSTIDEVAPFGGAYPQYSLSVTPPLHGRVTGGGLDCGGNASVCQVTLGAAATLPLTATPDAGHIFAGWTTDCQGGATTSVHVNGPKACSAVFEPAVSAAPRTLVYWHSQVGDYIGGGLQTVYSPLNSRWSFNFAGTNRVGLRIEDASNYWYIDFSAPTGTSLSAGYYGTARRHPFTPFNGLDASGSGRGCNELTGRFVILEIAFGPSGALERFAADLEQHCEDAVPALFASVRFNATVDEVVPFGGAYPEFNLTFTKPLHGRVTGPGLDCGGAGAACQVALGAAASLTLAATADFGYVFMGWTEDCSGGPTTPLHVNGPKRCGARFDPLAATAPRTLLHWDSQPGQGRSERLFPDNSRWTSRLSSGSGAEFYVESVGPKSDVYWTVGFVPPTGDVLQAGRRYVVTATSTSPSPTSAAFYIYGNGRFCAGGEFTVREVVMTSTAVLKFAVDFSLSCGSISGPALTGSLQYNSNIDVPPSTLTLDPASLRFASVHNGASILLQPTPQVVRLSLSRADVGWTVVASHPWITVTPSSGTGPATLTVAPNLLGGHPGTGTATGTVTVTLTDGTGTSKAVALTVTLYPTGTTSPPFGVVDTPLENSSGITGAIPVTGWVLDDVEVADVSICRAGVPGEVPPLDARCGGTAQIFVGNGIFIEGARPDVRNAYPTHPGSDAAGWGFMLLTNNLPNQGNGTYVLSVYTRDREGYVRLLGTRTITCDNVHATIPFGAIDTPAQGGTISGASYLNFGWALTQNPKVIPFDGSTLMVYIDGVPVGNPTYNNYRSDIATTFPGLANSNGAVGFRAIDLTALSDGLHTITWTAIDNAGGTAGLGSRFFRVANGSAGSATASMADGTAASAMSSTALSVVPLDTSPLVARRGWALDGAWTRYGTSSAGRIVVRGEELDRFELDLGGSPAETHAGFLRVGDRLGPLPSGSRLDAERGAFTWAPGPGFVGNYDLVFIRLSGGRPIARRDVRMVLHAKGSGRVGAQIMIDTPGPQQDVAQPFGLSGWAADLDAPSGTGIDVLHVWAYPLTGGVPVFLGTTAGAARPDVAAIHGEQFRDSGYGLVVQGLTPGNYDLAVFPWSASRGGFLPAQVVRVTVR